MGNNKPAFRFARQATPAAFGTWKSFLIRRCGATAEGFGVGLDLEHDCYAHDESGMVREGCYHVPVSREHRTT